MISRFSHTLRWLVLAVCALFGWILAPCVQWFRVRVGSPPRFRYPARVDLHRLRVRANPKPAWPSIQRHGSAPFSRRMYAAG